MMAKQEQGQIQKSTNPVAQIKIYLSNESVKKRFEDILQKRAGAFINSIINLVRNKKELQGCTPESVIGSAMIAATLNLPIDPSLGQAAIVPYKVKGKSIAQFQIMYKGVTQLCIRSGQYATIHCTEVYKDEIESWNPVTGEIEFTNPSTWKMRKEEKNKNVAGHYARLKLLSGFEKCDYMTTDEAIAHAKRYSKAYQYDIQFKKRTSAWSTDPIPMGNKTVLLRLLTKYGIMSIEMQEAFVADHVNYEDAQRAADDKITREQGQDIIDAEFEENKKKEEAPKNKASKKDKQQAEPGTKTEPKSQSQTEPQTEPETETSTNATYICKSKKCKSKGEPFDNPSTSKDRQGRIVLICPFCFTKNIEAVKPADEEKPEFMED
jgi:recombination protein RecT